MVGSDARAPQNGVEPTRGQIDVQKLDEEKKDAKS
jgi:hypothetical protein